MVTHKKIALFVPRFNFGGPPKLKNSNFQKANLDFDAQHPNFHLALKPKILKLEGSSFGNRSSIYVLNGWYNEIMNPLKKLS